MKRPRRLRFEIARIRWSEWRNIHSTTFRGPEVRAQFRFWRIFAFESVLNPQAIFTQGVAVSATADIS